jgi:hypothetical protein
MDEDVERFDKLDQMDCILCGCVLNCDWSCVPKIPDMAAPPDERSCPFCGRLQVWFSSDGFYIHWETNAQHCDEERLAYLDSAKLHKELS